MQKIELKCSNCGGQLDADKTQKDVFVCLHCGNKEIITNEPTSSNYYINQNITKNIYGNEQKSDDEYFKLIHTAEKFLQINEYKKAIKLLKSAINLDQSNSLAWWLCVKSKLLYNIYCKQNNKFTIPYTLNNIEKDLNIAENFTESNKQKLAIRNEFEDLVAKYKNNCENIENESENTEPANINNTISIVKRSFLIPIFFSVFLLIILTSYNAPLALAISLSLTIIFIGLLIIVALLIRFKQYKKIIEYIQPNTTIKISDLLKFCNDNKMNINEDDLSEMLNAIIKTNYLNGYHIMEDKIVKYK